MLQEKHKQFVPVALKTKRWLREAGTHGEGEEPTNLQEGARPSCPRA